MACLLFLAGAKYCTFETNRQQHFILNQHVCFSSETSILQSQNGEEIGLSSLFMWTKELDVLSYNDMEVFRVKQIIRVTRKFSFRRDTRGAYHLSGGRVTLKTHLIFRTRFVLRLIASRLFYRNHH